MHRFHPPAGRFDGVIGGPPCQTFSSLSNLQRAKGYKPAFGNLIPEFERVVNEARPAWFVMENVREAPMPHVPGYEVCGQLLRDTWVGGETSRMRRFSFGGLAGLDRVALMSDGPLLHRGNPFQAVTSSHGGHRRSHCNKGTGGKIVHYSLPQACELQGIASTFFDELPFTKRSALKMVANGVPLPMGRAVARAVRRALGMERAA